MAERLTRRTFAGAVAGAAAHAQQGPGTFAFVGCFTSAERKGRGDGIHVYRVDAKTGAWTEIQVLKGLVNPSFLQTGRDGRFLYSSHGDEEFATAYAIDPSTGNLRALNQGKTGGKNGAHLALSPDGRHAIVANYTGGSVAVLAIKADGGLDDYSQLIRLEGTPGPHRTEQPGPHPHQIVFDPTGRFVLVPDKGLDRVFIFRFEGGKLAPHGAMQTRSGAGPRHLAFHPSAGVVWVLNELGNTVTTCTWDGKAGTLTPIQTLSTLPEDFSGNSTAAEIAVASSGQYVYTSNRGHDSIASFGADPGSGKLKVAGWTPSGGKFPRFIALDPSENWLLATNEQSDTITRFRVIGGVLVPTGSPISNGSPVTITFRRS